MQPSSTHLCEFHVVLLGGTSDIILGAWTYKVEFPQVSCGAERLRTTQSELTLKNLEPQCCLNSQLLLVFPRTSTATAIATLARMSSKLKVTLKVECSLLICAVGLHELLSCYQSGTENFHLLAF